MELKVGAVVISKAGRDKGKPMAVLAVDGERVYLCDGKERPIERPKRKNVKHIAVTGSVVSSYDLEANGRLKKALFMLSENAQKRRGGFG